VVNDLATQRWETKMRRVVLSFFSLALSRDAFTVLVEDGQTWTGLAAVKRVNA